MSEQPHGSRRQGAGGHPDYLVAAVIILLCVVLATMTALFEEPPGYSSTEMAPATFPRIVIGVIAILAVVLVLTARRTPQEPALEPILGTHLATMGTIAVLVLLLPVLGALLLTFVAFMLIGLCWRRLAWKRALVIAMGVSIFIEVAIVRGLQVRLPQGWILPALMGA